MKSNASFPHLPDMHPAAPVTCKEEYIRKMACSSCCNLASDAATELGGGCALAVSK